MKPRRIQRKRVKGWRMPPNTVYVGRPSDWGNPFTGDDGYDAYAFCVAKFPVPRHRLKMWQDAGGRAFMLIVLASRIASWLRPLRGKNLCCWCKKGRACHVDILLKLANED